MPTLPVVNEKTSARLRVTLLDFDDVQQIPSTVTYRVDNVADGASIISSTALTPAGQIDIILLGNTANAVIDSTLDFERHRVTVEADYGGGDLLNGQFDYLVKNLSKVT